MRKRKYARNPHASPYTGQMLITENRGSEFVVCREITSGKRGQRIAEEVILEIPPDCVEPIEMPAKYRSRLVRIVKLTRPKPI